MQGHLTRLVSFARDRNRTCTALLPPGPQHSRRNDSQHDLEFEVAFTTACYGKSRLSFDPVDSGDFSSDHSRSVGDLLVPTRELNRLEARYQHCFSDVVLAVGSLTDTLHLQKHKEQ